MLSLKIVRETLLKGLVVLLFFNFALACQTQKLSLCHLQILLLPPCHLQEFRQLLRVLFPFSSALNIKVWSNEHPQMLLHHNALMHKDCIAYRKIEPDILKTHPYYVSGHLMGTRHSHCCSLLISARPYRWCVIWTLCVCLPPCWEQRDVWSVGICLTL